MSTKIKQLSVLCLLFVVVNIQAQEFSLGLSAGADITNIRITNSSSIDFVDYDPVLSLNLNAFAAYRSAGFLGVTVEPGFILKGAEMIDLVAVEKYEAYLYLFYFQLPLLVDFYLTDKLFVSIGPEFAWLIGATVYHDDNFRNFSDVYDKKFEISGMAAINYTILPKVDIALRYSHGFTKNAETVFTDINGAPIGGIEEYNQYLQLMIRARIFSSRQ